MNPLIAIGIGGRGCHAMALLKDRLQIDGSWIRFGHDTERSTPSNGNRISTCHIPVRLCAIDLDRAELAGLHLDHAEEVRVSVTPVGEVLQHLKNLEKGQTSVYPEIEAWLPREDAAQIEVLESMSFLDHGACQIRAFGRMGFLLDAQANDDVRSRLSKAISQLAAGSAGQAKLTVCVAASVAGGVGAGMLNDVLVSLQDARRRLAGQLSVRTIVFLILPAGFGTVLKGQPYEQAQANGRAALRELDRLINDHRTVRLEWAGGRTAHLDTPAADHVYLIDGSRATGFAQLEGHHKLDDTYSAPIATAIYTHLLSGSGATLASRYANLASEHIGKERNRYSTFGMYSIEYAWQSLERSLAHRAGRALLEALLTPAQADPATSARTWLSGDRTDASTDDGNVRPPQLLGDVLNGREEFARGRVEPTPSWLTPVQEDIDYPTQPTLKNEFPDIGRCRTPYISSDLKRETKKIIEDFFGADEAAHLDGFSPIGFMSIVNHNKKTMKKQFKRSIFTEVAALMEQLERIGCIDTGRRFLDAIYGNLDEIAYSLSQIPESNIRDCEEEVEAAAAKMDKSGALRVAHWQSAYLHAQQRLLRARVREVWRVGAVELVGEFRVVTADVRHHVTGWKERIEDLRNEAQMVEHEENGHRTASNEVPLRRVVPLPGSRADHKLYEDSAGHAPAASLPVRVREKLTRLRWQVDGGAAGTPRLSLIAGPEESVAGERASRANDHGEHVTLPDVVRLVAPLFTGLRQLSVFDVLAVSGEQARQIADELINGAAPLAAYSSQRQTADRGSELQKPRFVFADWPTIEGAGTELGKQVRDSLNGMQVDTSELAGSPPIRDRLLAFSADHFVALDAFRGVTLLDEAYRSKRLGIPSPHVFPEERAAARLEAQSEVLARKGFIGKHLDFIPGSHVGLCRDQVLLRHVAVAAAAGRLIWEWEIEWEGESKGSCDLLRESGGEIMLSSRNEISYPPGGTSEPLSCDDANSAGFVVPFQLLTLSGSSFENLLHQLIEGPGKRMEDARNKLRNVAGEVMETADAAQLLRNFAQAGWTGLNKCDDTTNELMMVAAGHCSSRVESGSWKL